MLSTAVDLGRLRALIEATPDMVVFFNLDGTVDEVNPSVERILRAPKAELVGAKYATFLPARSRARGNELLARTMSGENVEATLAIVRPDGSELEIDLVAGPLRLEERIIGAYLWARDVSEERAQILRLETSEERFRSVFDDNPDPMIALDRNATITRANAAAIRLLQCDRRALLGRTLAQLCAEIDFVDAMNLYERALTAVPGGHELLVRGAGRVVLPTYVTTIPCRVGGRTVGVDLHLRDLRGEREHQRQIEAHAERIRDLYVSVAAANDTAERQIVATLEAGCRSLTVTSAALYETATDGIVASVGEPIPLELVRLALGAEGPLLLEDLPHNAWLPDHAFSAFVATPIEVGGVAYGMLCFAGRRARPGGFLEVDRDLVQLMGALVASAIDRGRAGARLETLAYTDAVTGLPNRAWLIDTLRETIDEAARLKRSIAVLFLDLDRFKDINDTLGHASGDRVLRIVADRLKRAIRNADHVARMGGDEFVILAADASDSAALSGLAERVIAAVEEPLELDGSEHFVTTSIGIAAFPADGADAETLVKHADVAMYRAKDRGRNTYQFFTPALNATLQTRVSQEKTLRKALENGEFVVYYQPQHDLHTNALIAVEALVRWNHPRSGLIPPARFIPNAEISGLIVALGDFVLQTACTDIAALRAAGAPTLRVAVNLSARQFHQQRLARKVREYVDASGLDPTALELEITESVAMQDAQLSAGIMRELGAEGMRLAVDDFGTGYSSLGYLKRFPLDSIKIDRSFVADIMTETDDATIVRTVIAMAHALDLEVIAEGVETAEQLEFLRSEACERVQGFFYSPAIPRDALERYIDGMRAG